MSKFQIIHRDCGNNIPLDALLTEICPHCNGAVTEVNTGCINRADPFENNERILYTAKFIEATEKLVELARGSKTDDYGETWKRLGLMGIYIKIFIKEGRLNELIWHKGAIEKTSVKSESIRDTLMDLANYCIYGIIALDEGNIIGDETSAEYVNTMVKALLETMHRISKLKGSE